MISVYRFDSQSAKKSPLTFSLAGAIAMERQITTDRFRSRDEPSEDRRAETAAR